MNRFLINLGKMISQDIKQNKHLFLNYNHLKVENTKKMNESKAKKLKAKFEMFPNAESLELKDFHYYLDDYINTLTELKYLKICTRFKNCIFHNSETMKNAWVLPNLKTLELNGNSKELTLVRTDF